MPRVASEEHRGGSCVEKALSWISSLAVADLTEGKIRSEQLLDGQLLKVYRDDVRLPDGSTTVREWIDHPGAAAVVPLFEDGTTVLVRQYRYAAGQAFLEVPAGKTDEGEALEEVARRELEEETGWKAARFTAIGAAHPAIGYSNEVIHFFLAEDLHRGATNRDAGEFMELVTVDFEEVLAMVRRGDITDAKSIAALFYAEHYLARRTNGEKLP